MHWDLQKIHCISSRYSKMIGIALYAIQAQWHSDNLQRFHWDLLAKLFLQNLYEHQESHFGDSQPVAQGMRALDCKLPESGY